jgi:hypothetical protein
MPKDFLAITDLSKDEITELFHLVKDLTPTPERENRCLHIS